MTTTYNVYRRIAPAAQTLRASGLTSPSYQDTGLTNDIEVEYQVSATNEAGEGPKSSAVLVTPTAPSPDTTPPVVSNVTQTSVTQTGVQIGWTTNELAGGQVEYGLTTAYGSTTTLDSALTLSKSQSISGLTPGTLYHYQTKALDASGNPGYSTDRTVVTTSVGSPVVAQFPGSGANSGAALLALMANMGIDVIEIAGGTYHFNSLSININRSSRPLTVRLAGAVTFAGNLATSAGGQFYFGRGGACSYITMELAGATFDGYTLGDTGIVWLGNCHHITVNGPKTQNVTVTGQGPTFSWACYVSYDAGVAPHDIVLDDWIVQGSAKNYSALQAGQPVNANHIYARNWTVDQVSYAIYAYQSISDFQVSGWAISNSRRADRNYCVFFGNAVTGTYSNMTATASGGLENQGGMTDGGGNSGL